MSPRRDEWVAYLQLAESPAVLHVLGEQDIAMGIERGLDDQRIPEGERTLSLTVVA